MTVATTTWGGITLPTPTEFPIDIIPIQSTGRTWNAGLRQSVRGNKRLIVLKWGGASSAQRDTIESAWLQNASASEALQLPDFKVYNVMGQTAGLVIIPRYNRIKKHFRYEIEINVEEV